MRVRVLKLRPELHRRYRRTKQEYLGFWFENIMLDFRSPRQLRFIKAAWYL